MSGSGVGNAFAGGAASAEDASTVWTNPAGMTRFGSTQTAAALHLVTPSIKFENGGSSAAAFQPLGGDGGDAGGLALLPNMYVTMPIAPGWVAGVGINAPFGLVTEYDSDWLGRYQAVKSEVKTINLNPSIAWKMNNVSFGAGANFQRLDAEFTNAVNYSAALGLAAQTAAAGGQIPAAAVPPFLGLVGGLDAKVKIEGDDTAWGWNAGMIIDLGQDARIGAHYRSSMKYTVTGNVTFDKPAMPALPPTLAPIGAALSAAVNAQLADGEIRAEIELPPVANVSYFRMLNNRWDIMADVQWTGWSSIKELKFVRANGVVLGSTPENFDDTWRFSVGANYRMDDRWTLRGGLAYDQTPVNDTDRTPRLPDEDRMWFSLGATYKYSPKLRFDVGATYITVSNAAIHQNAGSTAANGLISGSYDSYITIFSGQVNYTF